MSMSIQCVMTAAVENGLRVAANDVCKAFAEKLAEDGMLTCKVGEAMALLATLEITTKRSAAMKKVRAAQKSTDGVESKKAAIMKKPEMVIPFCGEIEESWCKSVRFNHGLHTQCTNGPLLGGEYCKTCQKGAENSASSKPIYGDIRDRAAAKALEYRDPKGKLTTCYANVAKKMGLDLDRAKEVAKGFGWTIPADQLIESATKRGRPAAKGTKKTAVAKVKKTSSVKSNSMDDQIAKLVAEAAEEVLSTTAKVSAKKVVKVKAKKVKKADPAKKVAAEAKKVAAEAKKAAAEVKKVAAAELKAKKAEEKLAKKAATDAKKVAAAELKAKKAEEKLAKKAAAEAKKVAAAELKAKKAEEKLAKKAAAEAKKVAAAELKAKKAEEKKEKARVKSLEKKAMTAKAAAAFAKSVTTVESSEDELEAEEVAEEKVVETTAEEEEEDELELTDSMKVTIGETDYFKTKAFGLPAVLFSYPTGETVGAYDEASGEIQEIEFDD